MRILVNVGLTGQRPRKILNTRLLGQYTQAMTRLAYQPAITAEDRLAVTYYLALQDRIEEALANFAPERSERADHWSEVSTVNPRP